MRQHAVEDSLTRSLNRHRPTKRLAILEHETRGSTSSEMIALVNRDRTDISPRRYLAAEPFDRKIAAHGFRGFGDLLCQLR